MVRKDSLIMTLEKRPREIRGCLGEEHSGRGNSTQVLLCPEVGAQAHAEGARRGGSMGEGEMGDGSQREPGPDPVGPAAR